VLGALCSMNMSHVTDSSNDNSNALTTIITTVVQRVLQQCPWQVRCHQVKLGHTPLRDAACNPTCLPQVLELLVQADEAVRGDTILSSALDLCDTDGMTPVDHLVHTIQLGPYTEPSVKRLESLLKYARHTRVEAVDYETSTNTTTTTVAAASAWPAVHGHSSPLLQLLTLGNSFSITTATTGATAQLTSLFPVRAPAGRTTEQTDAKARLDRILVCVRLLLRWNPSLVNQTSRISGCSPLHVVIRNYGSCAPLVREVLQHDDENDNGLVRHRNHYGDLPLHVACSVGVPMDVLHLVLARTLIASSSSSTPGQSNIGSYNNHAPASEAPHSLVWSRNNSGYTPVDLEWIRHIEAGHGFFSHRSFYPLDARGVRRPGGRYDDLYDVLLRQAVDQVVQTRNANQTTATTTITTTNRRRTVAAPTVPAPTVDLALRFAGANDSTVGLLLHRIFLVIRASFRDSFSRSPHDLSGDILHQASALSGPHGPTLPRPVLELIFFQHPEQRERRDHTGKLPLHYAVQLHRAHEDASVKSGQEWKLWVQKLLCHAPESCNVKDHQGRLPLHYALEYPSSSASNDEHEPLLPQEARNSIIKDLVGRSPATIEMIDPVTKLHPYQLAATNPLVALDTVFHLLRRCPDVIAAR